MKKIRLAIIGLGKLGRRCVEAIMDDPTTEVAGVVRRPESAPASWLKAPAVTHKSELNQVDAALICVPVDEVLGVAKSLLQSRIPVVECARLHGEAFLGHKSDIHRSSHKLSAFKPMAYVMWEPEIKNYGGTWGSNPGFDASQYPDELEGVGRRHKKGAVILGFSGQVHFISF